MNKEDWDKSPISLDTALEAIAILQARRTGDEFQKLAQEKKIILGLIGNDEMRIELLNKVYDVYCPAIKNGTY